MAAPTLPNLLLSHAFLLLLTIITTTSSPSLASQPSNFHRPPRFLGKFSHPHHHHNYQQYRYETRYFYQRLDHFSFSNLPKFPQRYLINSDNWSGPDKLAPIFLYCGNEGDIVWFAENTGFIPYGSRDEAYKNASTLSYLTAEQALADFAVLITDLKRNLTAEDCPVVLFGGSYGGMLAAWMRLKYPHIAIGALAASAPILQFENVVPHEIFYDIVSNDFKRESSRCFNTIKESWNAIASEGLKENGLVKLSRTFHMCSDLNSTDELADWLESAYSYLAMVDYPYPAEFMMPLPGHPIREVTFYFSTSKLSHIVYPCLHILDFRNWCSGIGMVLACTEMVMPMASSKYESMFPTYDFNYTSFEKQCWDDFRVVSRPRWIMTEFGGQDIKTSLEKFGSNIIFSNGLLDPWSGGSVLQNISDTVVALVTEEGAHHIDLRPSTPEDPDWLVEQRATEVKLIEGWINDHNQKKRATFDM
eukprot:XP_025015148.1 lysosomal Pro-X carboxypeptidase [Ricinus communis]